MGLSPHKSLGKEEGALRGEGRVSLNVWPPVAWKGSRLRFVGMGAGLVPSPSGNSSGRNGH